MALSDRYDILELIGEGGMGAVYRARDRELDEIVALKMIRKELVDEPAIVERFRREVKLARRVTHANVARTFELGSADGQLFCTMELVDGESLTKRLARDRRIALSEAVAIACAMCDGLAAAHAVGVIHRDIKPDNILLANDGRVVMADFGVASVAAGDRGELSGTPVYMAPEQARGEPATPAADVYALGIVLHEMITGRRAFAGEAVQVLGDKQVFDKIEPAPGECPPELAAVIGRATAREPAARVASAKELRAALAPWERHVRLDTQPALVADDHHHLATIVVLAPRGETKRYLAEALYDDLLAKLTREPHLRVLSREDAIEEGAVTLHLETGESLIAHAERGGVSIVRLELPLSIDQLATSAEAIYRAVCKLSAPRTDHPDPQALEAFDLVLHARHAIRRDIRLGNVAAEQAERALSLLPHDPRVLATIAIVTVRRAFFLFDASEDAMARAGGYARRAMAAAPELVDSHLALAHVEFNLGNPHAAARLYRSAIARSPHSAEAHEYMGRMLIEAGFLDEGFGRLDEAMAINPARRGLLWEVARAHALEGRWDEHAKIVARLTDLLINRPFARARMAIWRREPGLGALIRPELEPLTAQFAPGLMDLLIELYSGREWAELRDQLVSGIKVPWPNRRRRTWAAQIVAEACGWAGDGESALALVEYASGDGLFDLHWLDKCPVLDCMREHPRFAEVRVPIQRRADGVLDAMYGDHSLGTLETAAATS
jgi:serine/threonine-protein kinase